MLKALKLNSVILIDSCEIPFASGLNIISGETGAGKSAIIWALDAICGVRADTSIIRKGSETATIEAIFDDGQTIKREIHRSKPSKAWINGKQVSIQELCSQKRFEQIRQGAYHTLKSPAEQLKLLDELGQTCRITFSEAYAKVLELGPKPNTQELTDIEALNLQENEEEKLFEEHSRLSNSTELTEKTQQLIAGLDHITNELGKLKRLSEEIESCESITSALTELQEAHYHYSHLLESFESNPERLKIVEERLSAISDVKRKFNCAFADLHTLLHQLQTKTEQIETATQERDALAQNLSQERQAAAKHLSEQITSILRNLGMPKSRFDVEITPSSLSITGADAVQFLLAANPGEAAIPVHTRASGGELSRIMLALKILSKQHVPTYIFDEIDSNIGGETASCIGQKLKELGKTSQIICITHFPQVAAFADHHLQITKTEANGRTLAHIKKLDDNSPELLRMLGGKAFTKKF